MKHGHMKTTRLYSRLGVVASLAMVTASGAGCSMQSGAGHTDSLQTASVSQYISTPLATAPSYNSTTKVVAVVMKDEAAEIYVNPADSSLMINGVQAVEALTGKVAYAAGSKANVTTVTVNDASGTGTGDILILNYINGVFGLGKDATAANAGTMISLDATAGAKNTLIVKGTSLADSYAVGPTGISLTMSAKTPTLDIVGLSGGVGAVLSGAHIPAFNFFMNDGNDTFTSNAPPPMGGSSITGGPFVTAPLPTIAIFGGNGDDTLKESAAVTPNETFSGGPGNDTVDYSARAATLALSGTSVAMKNGSNTVTGIGTAFSTDLAVGKNVTFTSQPGVYYQVAAIASNTSMTLTGNYTGLSTTQTALAGGATFNVTTGSGAVTATGSSLTTALVVGQQVTFDAEPGVNYTVSALGSTTAMTVTPVFTGVTSATSNAYALSEVTTGAASNGVSVTVDTTGAKSSGYGIANTAALTGTAYSITKGGTALTAMGSLFTTELVVGQRIMLSSQPGVYYTVSATGSATAATLATAYTGATTTTATGTKLFAPTNCSATRVSTEGDVILDADVITGSPSEDMLQGDVTGAFALNGGLGNDVFCEGADSAKNGTDTLSGGGGVDAVDYSQRTAMLNVVMDGKTKSGDPTGNTVGMTVKGEGDIIGADVQNVYMGSGGAGPFGGMTVTWSIYTGNTMNNTFFAGTAGFAVVNGSDGNDTLDEGATANNGAAETFNGGKGIDTVDYSKRTAAITATMDGHTGSGESAGAEGDLISSTDVEQLYGGSATDTLTGNALDNDIEGNGGGDTICGDLGNDTLIGNTLASDALAADAAILHGNDLADTAEPGAFNLCLRTGTGAAARPLAANANNCEFVSQ